ncbi:MAG: HDOD domain-containing protein [Xanthomonadales bacterium]|nr:HDOD domain-containing protein [Xanthomonadales bacterium]
MTELLIIGPRDEHVARLHRALSAHDQNWSVVHSADAQAALDRMVRRSADVVISCLATAEECEQLFAKVVPCAAGAIRVALLQSPATTVRGAHQTLSARTATEELVPMLAAAAKVAKEMSRSQAMQKIMAQFQEVPSPPQLYFDIRDELEGINGTPESLARIAGRDPALVARVLRVANSGFYARPRKVVNLADAISLLGTDAFLGLVLAAHLYAGLPPPGLRLDRLWEHAFEVSTLAQSICRLEGGDRKASSDCLIAGLLHDIGLLVLLQNEPGLYQPLLMRSAGDEGELVRLEQETFGLDHGQLGAMILELWNLSAGVVTAVAHSHALAEPRPDDSTASIIQRSVMAAECLLDNRPSMETGQQPQELESIPEAAIQRWVDARNQLGFSGSVA